MKFYLVTFLFTFSTFVKAVTIDTEKLFLDNLLPPLKLSTQFKIISVSSVSELLRGLKQANKNGDTILELAPGNYKYYKTLSIKKDNIIIRAKDSSNPFNTVLTGRGMAPTKQVNNLIRVSGANFVLEGVTLENVGNHLLQIKGERGAHNPIIRNNVFQNGYEQLIKITYNKKQIELHSKNGIIENNLFRYTKGIGPNYYIGGIDAHGIQNYVVRNNVFDGIASPSRHIAEHAIHIWNNTIDNHVIGNIIVNSDRGIGFGMRNGKKNNVQFRNKGGTIERNIIYHGDLGHPYADTAIILEESPDTLVTDNLIFMEHDYDNAIEVRFPQTQHTVVKRNITNKKIITRDGGKGVFRANKVDYKLAKNQLLMRLGKYIDDNGDDE